MTAVIERATAGVDTVDMIISEEQVQRSLQYLYEAEDKDQGLAGAGAPASSVSEDLLRRVAARLEGLPETRPERVSEARALLAAGAPTSDAVAEKIIGRAISDTVR